MKAGELKKALQGVNDDMDVTSLDGSAVVYAEVEDRQRGDQTFSIDIISRIDWLLEPPRPRHKR